ncbi:molybdate ABC transporter substrate-binding protein [Methylophaga sp.]|uniref:molybdate ABC transporter substrate-binding protein n=1 Tax=Methylophaga sp. TaxID=2024840 RepID=UPI002727A0CA|nr:molybdate ABC transporter substrate-binding protein [Methylophaga sp.]MDO8828090.1 molybdate ABC transporter substrate-binding protein [Methylophaga sp.]
MTTLKKTWFALVLLIQLFTGVSYADIVNVAIATNFTAPMKEIAIEFEKDTGYKTLLSFASSGKLFAQINNGAPFDVFLSADTHKPEQLELGGLSVTGSRFTYAIGALVLWSPISGIVDKNGDVLFKNQFRHIAIANPKVAPYGAAAQQVMEKLGVWTEQQSKLVQGENIAQTYQFVASGNAQIGFVALTQVMANGKITTGSGWIVPASMHSPIKQDAVLLNFGKNNPVALEFLDYMKSDKAKTIIQSYGYSL